MLLRGNRRIGARLQRRDFGGLGCFDLGSKALMDWHQLEYQWSMARKRLQIELGPSEELALARVKGLGSSDAEIGRKAISLLGRLAIAIQDGFTVAIVPGDEARYADAVPELTDAVMPERRYRHLVAVRHPWRRQLSLKGRRITVGQLVSQMRENGLTVADAACEFDLDTEAVAEALEYAANHEKLLEAEAAEDRRRADPATLAPPR